MENSDTNVEEEDIGPSRLLKRTVSCFGKAKPFNLLTSIRDCHSVRYTKSVGQLVTRLGLCGCGGLPVWAKTVSTCWVFALTSIVPILILELNYYAVPRLLIFSLSVYRPEEAQVCYLETRGVLNSRSIQGISELLLMIQSVQLQKLSIIYFLSNKS